MAACLTIVLPLILKCNNIFRSNTPHTMEINQSGQYSRLWKLDVQRG
ncbi:MAG: hypothetical protein ACLR6J_06615 [Parabacteroides merdae]